MATRQLPGTFRTLTGVPHTIDTNINCVDASPASSLYQSIRSPGATLIDVATPGSQINQVWTLQSVGVRADIALQGGVRLYGKLGRILTGIVLPPNAQATPGSSIGAAVQPWVSPLLALPDPTLTAPLWDPVNDVLPPLSANQLPINAAPSNFLQVSTAIQLPQPVDMRPGDPIGLGIWILPSLIGSPTSGFLNVLVYHATYVLVYEETIVSS